MVKVCTLCGHQVEDALDNVKSCPNCGTEFVQASSQPHEFRPVRFPPRKSTSLTDSVEESRQAAFEFTHGVATEVRHYLSWVEIARRQPFDNLFFTAFNKIAYLLVTFSADLMPEPEAIGRVIESDYPMGLEIKTFLHGSYPLMRCHLLFPDVPADPLFLETPQDIRNGDFQDFCNAILAREQLDLILSHESFGNAGGRISSWRVPGLAQRLVQELELAIPHLRLDAELDEREPTLAAMRKAFPSGADGVRRENCIPLKRPRATGLAHL